MKEKEILKSYLPEKSIDQVMEWIIQKKVYLKITKTRSSKLGDYRPPIVHPVHRISINHNLNHYAFLITFVHELAHLIVWENYKNQVAPHGVEWKTEYQKLMTIILKNDIFPKDIKDVLAQSIINSKASSGADIRLSRVLKKYDKHLADTHLEDLKENAIFKTKNGIVFKKGKKRRIRYLCYNVNNNKQYLFHPLTPVDEIDSQGC